MKKYRLIFSIFICLFLLCSCSKSNTVKPTKDTNEFSWYLIGDNQLIYNDNVISNSYKPTTYNKLALTSINFLNNLLSTSINEDIVKYVYYISNINLGTIDSKWDTLGLIDDKEYIFNGSYTIKLYSYSFNSLDNKWIKTQALCDFKTTNVQSITPNTLFVPSNTDNYEDAICIDGPGTYDLYLVKFIDNYYDYGIALFKNENQDGIEPQENNRSNVNNDNLNIILNNQKTALEKVDKNTFKKTIFLTPNDIFTINNYKETIYFTNINFDSLYFSINIFSQIKVKTKGYFSIIINKNKDYDITIKPSSYCLIGSFNEWKDTHSLLNKENDFIYSIEIFLSQGDELRIIVDEDYSITLGIDDKGNNLKINTTGNYLITFNIDTLTLSATLI